MSTQGADRTEETRMVHPSLGGSTPFWRGMTVSELALFILPLFIGFLLISTLPTNTPATPVFALVVFLELVLLGALKVKPKHYRLTEFLGIQLAWSVQDDHHGSGDEETDIGTAVRLQEVHDDAVERVGDHYVGAVEVKPANLALKDDDTWADAVGSLTNFVTSTLEFESKIYVSSREVDETGYVEAHRDRLSDSDVGNSPALKMLVEDVVENRTDQDGRVDRNVPPQRRFYIVTWVTDDDIIEQHEDDESLLKGLSMIPFVGRVFDRFRGGELTDEEIAENKRRKLQDRLDEVRHGVSNLYRCHPQPVGPYELARLVREYWTCGTEEINLEDSVTSPFVRNDTATTVDDGGDDDGESSDESERTDESIGRRHQHHRRAVAPSDIQWEKDHAVINDETYARTFWVEAFPEKPSDGFLRRLILETDLNADISIHLDPYTSQSAVDLISEWIASLEATKRDSTALKQEDIEQEIQEAKQIRELVRRNETSLVRTGVFIRLTAGDKEELRRQTNRLQSLMRDAPANSIVKKVVRRTEEGLATVSPIGRNELGSDRLSTMTAEAVGAMFPFSSNYLRMDGGIEYGTHVDNDSEVRINPWELDTGHSELVTGMPGAGKSHASQARGLRTLKRHDDALQVIVDPVGGMRGTAEALNAKYITVSGKTPLNPCEMQPTPEHVFEQSRDMQPVAAKKDEVFGVVENFLASRDIDLEMHSGVITHVIDTIFERSAIDPNDPSTHTPANSPTMQDFLDVLDEITEHPERFEFTTEAVQRQVVQYASELSVAMQPFREGSTYANLSKRSDLDVVTDDSKVVYLDLQQVEGSGDGMGKQSFIMQLLLSTIYQQAKRTEQNVEVIIDEAHYLFNDTENLEFLNQIARHQRHAGIRLVMLTQTLQEFYDGGAAEEIASMCPIKVHHREPGLDDETADRADLTDAQQWFVQSAEAGKRETGYSEALVRVDEHGDYPVRITTSEVEKTVIEYDGDARGELEAILEASDPEHVQELRDLLEHEAVEQTLAERYDVPEPVAHRLVEEGLTEAELVAGVAAAVEGRLRDDEQTRRALRAARATIRRTDGEDNGGWEAVATDGADANGDRSTDGTARTDIGKVDGGDADRPERVRSMSANADPEGDDDERERIRDRLRDRLEE